MKICTGACKKCSEKPEPECGEICREMAELQLDLLTINEQVRDFA